MAHNIINHYIWLIDTLYTEGPLTFEQISTLWQSAHPGSSLPLRTFHYWRTGAEDTFGINIECDVKNGYRYYIENPGQLEKGKLHHWLLNTLSVGNLLLEYKSLYSRILVEDIPSGHRFLPLLLKALKARTAVRIEHRSFLSDASHVSILHPYCIKLFKRRWYVVGYSSYRDAVRIYGLDRIYAVEPTTERYQIPKAFDAAQYFRGYFGVIADDSVSLETVRLKVCARQANYLRSLPLHPSQVEEARTDEYSIFSLQVRPTFDFRQELLSHGSDIEVLSPDWLRQDIINELKSAMENYS